ncbi:maleylpyruvate isomerase [Georgenia satyanarayanai]|uniref:Maleylpyruvate isomerase n=1 Tax=Georgenia satyanarayanai TaxID=860221 RepID=A0A2Y9ADU7_9MICO|nr:maleylpyruvate isomerase family mycothiol-dependent enzyme [Georgenia satyanarayanai]PYF99510.1 maleylpyruvate isomerase [Georgenia satyanarayanai]SSA42355.1 maleylpyruvate isomerase [Georgenia satyanarayanai]
MTGGPLDTDLEWVRSGSDYFARQLAGLGEEDLAGDSLLPAWTRGAVVAHVASNAEALRRLCHWARTGEETPMYPSEEARDAEIARGAALPLGELRRLYAESRDALDGDWRGLPAEAWEAEVRTRQGRRLRARETVWMRAREVWIHGVDLAAGGSFRDVPPAVVDRLTTDVLEGWEARGEAVDMVLHPTDRDRPTSVGSPGPTISGSAADLAQWLTGRGGAGLKSSTGELPALPRWL